MDNFGYSSHFAPTTGLLAVAHLPTFAQIEWKLCLCENCLMEKYFTHILCLKITLLLSSSFLRERCLVPLFCFELASEEHQRGVKC